MADASCSGPSPFKQLVDQQNRDVSRHQDRLVNGAPGPGQHSFRSQQGHPGQSQNEFGAFMDGNAHMQGPSQQLHAAGRLAAHAAALEPLHPQSHPPLAQQNRISPAPDTANWAADFSRFQPPQPQQRQQPFAPQAGPASYAPPAAQNRMAEAFGFQSNMAAMQPNAGFSPLYGPMNGGHMNAQAASAQRPAQEADFDEEMSRWMAVNGGGAVNAKAMEDVDAVMEQMAKELELNDQALDETSKMEGTNTMENGHFTDLGTTEIGNLSQREEPLEDEAKIDPKARSEVSEAAERLLESVQHEDGEKWKNSVFLSLMRDFRDGRKDIVDNEIRGVNPEDVTENVMHATN